MDNTRIQLDTGFIDLPKGTNFPITYSFNDFKLSGASGGYSQSIMVDGTPNNSKQLGDLFDVDLSNETFNRNIKTSATVIQDGGEVFTGFLQLMEVVRVNDFDRSNDKRVKYKITVFDEVANFYIQMADKEISELSFQEHNHVFNRTNILASWNNTEGYIYPQFAKSDALYTLRDFKPAIFELDYFKKIFASNGYSYTWASFDDSLIRMDKRIIPFNGKEGDEQTAAAIKSLYTVQGTQENLDVTIDATNVPDFPMGWLPFRSYLNAAELQGYTDNVNAPVTLDDITQDPQDQWSTNRIENKAGDNRTWNLLTQYDYEVDVKATDATGIGGVDVAWKTQDISTPNARCRVYLTLVAQSLTDSTKYVYIDTQVIKVFLVGTSYSYGVGYESLATGNNFSSASLGLFDNNEEFKITPIICADYISPTGSIIPSVYWYNQMTPVNTNNSLINVPLNFVDASTNDPVRLNFDIRISNLKLKAVPDINTLVKGATVELSRFIPTKVKQRDIISSIVKSYNLVFVPDPDDEKNIIIKTRDEYFDDGEEWDWTGKIDESKDNNITFLSNEVNREQVFTYKEDKDTLNQSYQDEVKEVYGQTTIELDNEYTGGEDKNELIYSPTPSIESGIGKILPSINGINPDNNIRVLLNNGKKTCYQYPFYDDILPNGTPLFVDEYLHTSMYDNDEVPNFSILFNAPKLLFHGFQQSQTTNYLYNIAHRRETTNINQGKMLVGYFNLTPSDANKLSKKLDYNIYIKNNGWFYINKIDKYNAGKRTLTRVELITADDESNIKYKIDGIPPAPVKPPSPIGGFYGEVDNDSNIIINSGTVEVIGKYNYITASDVYVIGDQNTVAASKTTVNGDNNTILSEAYGAKVVGNNQVVRSGNVSGDAAILYKARLVQTGTSAPVITEYINTTGLNITANRGFPGVYSLIGFEDLQDGSNYEIEFSENIQSDEKVVINIPTNVAISITTIDGSGVAADGILRGNGSPIYRYNVITLKKYE